jgi:hypothetical protein
MRFVAAIALLIFTTGCRGSEIFKQYEYEEEVYLDLDGSATVYVNASVPALDALRGAPFNTTPNARLDLNAVRQFFNTPVTRVTRVNSTRRNNRRFVHVRLDVKDVRELGRAAPFAWSTYQFVEEPDRFSYRQGIGGSAGAAIGPVNWDGTELVAFRVHLPSNPITHNAGEENHKRGNILVYEQPLTDRLMGRPIMVSVDMETESILASTLWLFAATVAGVGAAFGIVVWSIARRGPASSGV